MQMKTQLTLEQKLQGVILLIIGCVVMVSYLVK